MKISDYEILNELGLGSTSVVYRVKRGSQFFAMKVLKPSESDNGLYLSVRFRKEAALLARMRSSGLPRIYEVGEFEGQSFVVMEMAPGESLEKHLLRQSCFTEITTLHIAKSLASVLIEVHRLGLGHRDIKPENILFDGSQSVKLIDFGFAEEFDNENSAKKEAAGTMLYASPEQTGMLKRAVDARSDLYSLGAVLFELLTGRPPFQSSLAVELMKMHATTPAPDVRSIRQDLSPVLASIIAKLLSKDPDDRYQTAIGLLYDLENISTLQTSSETNDQMLDRQSHRISRTQEVKLIGRHEEMEVLRIAMDEARQKRGQIIQIEGEGGTGKSRLGDELIFQTESQSRLVLRGKCQAADTAPLGIFREILDDYALSCLRLQPQQSAAEIEIIKNAAGRSAPLLRRLSKGLAHIFGEIPEGPVGDAASERDRTFWALTEFLVQLSNEHKLLILILDDIQWLDSSSLEILRRLAGVLSHSPILFITTARNSFENAIATTNFVTQIGENRIKRLHLKPLSSDEVAEYASSFLGGGKIEKQLSERLSHVTNGNAFAIGEYIRAMLDLGILLPSEDEWKVDSSRMLEITVSQNVIELIVSRLRELTSATAEILSAAAVFGNVFDTSLLNSLHNNGREVINALEEAVRANLCERVRSDRYAFVHDCIREALIANLHDQQLREIHQKLALIIEGIPKKSHEDHFALARHYLGGHFNQNALKIYESCLVAGRTALDAYSNQQAYDLLTQSFQARKILELNSPLPSGRQLDEAELDESLGQAALRLSRLDEAHEHFNRCLQRTKQPHDMGKINFFISQTYMAGGDAKKALVNLLKSFEQLGRPVPSNSIHLWFSMLGLKFAVWFLRTTNLFKGSAQNQDRPQRQLIARMLSPASQITYFVDRVDLNSLFILREFINSHFLGTPLEIARASVYYAFYHSQFRNIRLIHRFGSQGQMLSEQTGDWGVHAFCRHQYAVSAAFGGDDVSAEKLFHEAIPFLKKYLGLRDASVTAANLATCLHYRGFSRESVGLIYREQNDFAKTNNGLQKMIVNSLGYSQCLLLGRLPEAFDFLKKLDATPEAIRDLPAGRACLLTQDLFSALDQMDLGEQVEKLITDFYKMNSKTFFFWTGYILVGHVRLQQLLKSKNMGRVLALKNLNDAIRIMRTVTPIPALSCHLFVFRSAVAAEAGQIRRSLRLLEQAQKLAEASNSKWGMYEVAAQRARVYSFSQETSMAQTYAEMALDITIQQGWKNRALYLKKEFSIEKSLKIGRSDQLSSNNFDQARAILQNEALLRVSLASTQSLDLNLQARAALDELNKVLNADRAFLFLQEEGGLKTQAGRDSSGQDLEQLTGYSTTVVKQVAESRTPMVVSGTDQGEVKNSESIVLQNLRSIIAAPLVLRDQFFGVIYLDSRVAKGMFSKVDLDILVAVAGHIAIALQTAGLARRELQRQELEKDLALTAAVQSFFLPINPVSESRNFSLHGYYQAATQASGDWWWYEMDSNESITIMLGDVTGHGVASAMMTASNASHFKMIKKLTTDQSPIQTLKQLNVAFLETAQQKFLMTMAMVQISPNGLLELWSAGGPSIEILRATGEVDSLTAPGSPLGLEEFTVGYKSLQLRRGDRVFMATDGVFELALENGLALTERRLRQLLQKILKLDISAATQSLVQSLAQERGKAPLEDDMTIVMIDYLQN